jgi:glutathione S-transferase
MKLYRFDYSCYARKVQMVLDLLALRYEVVDVPYGDRSELAAITGGYMQVPALVDDAGKVTVDSRAICEMLLRGEHAERLVPSPWQGPIWAYADWCDSVLEDVLFRIASPGLRRRFSLPGDRALFTFIKERKFGRGCVEQWEHAAGELTAQARALLTPTAETLRRQRFLFGDRPTLADAALYGQCVMLRAADPTMPASLADGLSDWMTGLEAGAKR